MRFEFSTEVGRPIAICKGGKMSGEIIHINDSDENQASIVESDETEVLLQTFFKKLKGSLNMIRMDRLLRAILERKRPSDTQLEALYDKAMEMLSGSKGREVYLNDGELEPVVDWTTERTVSYITGMSGSGKSHYTSNLAKVYHRTYPKNKIYLFSNKGEDPNFDVLPYVNRVEMNSDLYENPLTLDDLRNTLVIFDDVEAIFDKNLAKEIDRLKDLILQQGRSYRVSFIYISHLANDYKRTRTILNESHSITIFPQMCSEYSLKYLLEKYYGFGKDDIKRIRSLPSRWVTIFRAPITVLYTEGCYLI